MKKCIAKHFCTDPIAEVQVYADNLGITSAYLDDNGNLIAEFESLEAMQEWNANTRSLKSELTPVYNQYHKRYVWGYCSYIQMKANHLDYHEDYDNKLTLYDTEEYAKCFECGEILPKDTMTLVSSGMYVCEDCLDSEYSYCDNCGQFHPNDDMVEMHTSTRGSYDHPYYVCTSCAEDIGHMCEHCEEWFEEDQMREAPDGTWYCEDHFYDHCEICSHCGDVIWHDDAYFDENGDAFCEWCYERYGEHENDSIRGYHDDPEFIKHYCAGEEKHGLLIGTEVETDSEDDNVDERVEVTNRYGDDEEYIYQMHDGSLSDYGIECITQPMSKKFWDKFDFEGWMKDLVEAGARAHDTGTCGLHVHLSRAWMKTDNREEQALLVGRMRQFLADNEDLVEKFARRQSGHWCQYKKSFDKTETPLTKEERQQKHKDNAKDSDRYTSVNNTNSETIEFRIFKGTLKPNTYRASVEFCLRVVDYIVTHEENTETWQDFMTYQPLPQSMITYMTERGMQTTF